MFRHDLSSITGFFLKGMHLIQRKAPLRHVVMHCPPYKTMSCQSLTQVSIRTPDSCHSRSGFSGLLWGECYLPKASGCSSHISTVHRGRAVITRASCCQQVKLVTYFFLALSLYVFVLQPFWCMPTSLYLRQYFWVKGIWASNELKHVLLEERGRICF